MGHLNLVVFIQWRQESWESGPETKSMDLKVLQAPWGLIVAEGSPPKRPKDQNRSSPFILGTSLSGDWLGNVNPEK